MPGQWIPLVEVTVLDGAALANMLKLSTSKSLAACDRRIRSLPLEVAKEKKWYCYALQRERINGTERGMETYYSPREPELLTSDR